LANLAPWRFKKFTCKIPILSDVYYTNRTSRAKKWQKNKRNINTYGLDTAAKAGILETVAKLAAYSTNG
jgi:hypothetical protein